MQISLLFISQLSPKYNLPKFSYTAMLLFWERVKDLGLDSLSINLRIDVRSCRAQINRRGAKGNRGSKSLSAAPPILLQKHPQSPPFPTPMLVNTWNYFPDTTWPIKRYQTRSRNYPNSFPALENNPPGEPAQSYASPTNTGMFCLWPGREGRPSSKLPSRFRKKKNQERARLLFP